MKQSCSLLLYLSLVLLSYSVGFKYQKSFSRIIKGANSLRMSESDDLLLKKVSATHPKDIVVVIKYGGHAMENDELKKLFCMNIAQLCKSTNVKPVIVHGGGPQIASMLKNLNVESKFVDGLRVTDENTMKVAQMVLCGSVNKEITSMISRQGVKALGLSGLDSNLIQARQINEDLGLVGEPTKVNAEMIKALLSLNIVPVIAPVGSRESDGHSLNINADTSAGAVASALNADVFLLLTDIVGVLDKDKKLIEKITRADFEALKVDGTISGGMIPKLENAIQAVEAGCGAVKIMDGREKHCILRALSGEVFGTVIVK